MYGCGIPRSIRLFTCREAGTARHMATGMKPRGPFPLTTAALGAVRAGAMVPAPATMAAQTIAAVQAAAVAAERQLRTAAVFRPRRVRHLLLRAQDRNLRLLLADRPHSASNEAQQENNKKGLPRNRGRPFCLPG